MSDIPETCPFGIWYRTCIFISSWSYVFSLMGHSQGFCTRLFNWVFLLHGAAHSCDVECFVGVRIIRFHASIFWSLKPWNVTPGSAKLGPYQNTTYGLCCRGLYEIVHGQNISERCVLDIILSMMYKMLTAILNYKSACRKERILATTHAKTALC